MVPDDGIEEQHPARAKASKRSEVSKNSIDTCITIAAGAVALCTFIIFLGRIII